MCSRVLHILYIDFDHKSDSTPVDGNGDETLYTLHTQHTWYTC